MLDTLGPLVLSDLVDRNHPLNRGRVAWWRVVPGLDGGRLWYDLMGPYHGVLTNMTAGSGWHGTARPGGEGEVLFDGSDDQVVIPGGVMPSGDLTVSLSVMLRAIAGYYAIFCPYTGNADSFEIFHDGGNAGSLFGGNFASQANTAAGSIAADVWYRVTLVGSGSATQFYLDGKLNGTPGTQSFTTRGVAPVLGSRPGGLLHLPGSLDDVSIWDRALSLDEIRADHELSRAGHPGVLLRRTSSVAIVLDTVLGDPGVEVTRSASASLVLTATSSVAAVVAVVTRSASASLVLTSTASEVAGVTRSASASLVLTAVATDSSNPIVGATAAISFGVTADARLVLPATEPAGSPRGVLRSGISGRYPYYFAEASAGVVLAANGIDPMLRWDGSSSSAEVAGVPAPATSPAIEVQEGAASTSKLYGALRYVDRHGNVSDLSPLTDGTFASAVNPDAVTYTGVEIPSGVYATKVARRQILRNTLGQVDTFYVDVDTYDLTSTEFSSTRTDEDLSGQEAVPFEDDMGEPLANAHGFPPSHKAVVVAHLGRMFAAGEVSYRDGHVAVTADSAAVTGVGTDWPASLAGRKLYIPGASASFAIESVDVEAQSLVLAEPYRGATDPFALYAIKAHPGERKLVYFTPAGEPESWPATYAIEVQEDGDEVTGLMPMASFLYILERRHIYRFTFKDNPATDGGIFLSSQRGCLNARLWVQAEDAAYMLDEMGVHAFSGGESRPISAPVQDLFRDDSDSPLRINWSADSTLWHASYSEVHATVRFFVAMTGSRLPRHALCYNYRAQRWWIEAYTRPITASCRGRIGTVRALAGTDHREILALDVGYTEGARDGSGTLRGTATSSTPLSLTDAAARFAGDLVNAPLHLVSGRGKGQWRRIVAVSAGGTRLDVDRPWLVAPDAGTGYAAAGVAWEWRSGTFRFVDLESSNPRDVEMVYQPNAEGAMDLHLYYDHANAPRDWAVHRPGAAEVTAGDSAVTVDLTDPRGRADHRLDGHLERNAGGDRYVAAGLSGVQVGEPVRVYRVTMNGVEAEG